MLAGRHLAGKNHFAQLQLRLHDLGMVFFRCSSGGNGGWHVSRGI
jgi:hypothetical protein